MRIRWLSAASILILAHAATARSVPAQRVALDVEGMVQHPSIDGRWVNAGSASAGVTGAASIARRGGAAWIVAGQAFATMSGGEDLDCAISAVESFCIGHIDVHPRGSMLTGASITRGNLVLRALTGMMVYHEEHRGLRPAFAARADVSFPARQSVAVVGSLTHSRLGSLYGRNLVMRGIAIGLRVQPGAR